MDSLEGMWRLVESSAQDEFGRQLNAPYGARPMGQLLFCNGRMLASLCNGDTELEEGASRGFSSYGGVYTFDGATLVTEVDVASETARIGGRQVRKVLMEKNRMILKPPLRAYGSGARQQRTLVWECIWRPTSLLPGIKD
jgi:hypothetical protein